MKSWGFFFPPDSLRAKDTATNCVSSFQGCAPAHELEADRVNGNALKAERSQLSTHWHRRPQLGSALAGDEPACSSRGTISPEAKRSCFSSKGTLQRSPAVGLTQPLSPSPSSAGWFFHPQTPPAITEPSSLRLLCPLDALLTPATAPSDEMLHLERGPSGLRHLAKGAATCAGEERGAEAQNHRIVGVGRDLCGSSSPTLQAQPSPDATSMTASSYLLSGSKPPAIQDILRNFPSMLTVLTHT